MTSQQRIIFRIFDGTLGMKMSTTAFAMELSDQEVKPIEVQSSPNLTLSRFAGWQVLAQRDLKLRVTSGFRVERYRPLCFDRLGLMSDQAEMIMDAVGS